MNRKIIFLLPNGLLFNFVVCYIQVSSQETIYSIKNTNRKKTRKMHKTLDEFFRFA